MPTNDSPLVPVLSDEEVAREIEAALDAEFGEWSEGERKKVAAIIARHTAARTAKLRKDVEYWQHVAGDAQIKAKELEARTGKLVEALHDVCECLEDELSRRGCQTESAAKKSDADSRGGLAALTKARAAHQNNEGRE